MFEICVEHNFAAAHQLRNYRGKCENLHGHNYRVEVSVEGEELQENGLLFDFTELKKSLRTTTEYLDHQYLNELEPFTLINPSAENVARFIFEEMQADLPHARIAQVKVWETDTSWAVYRPKRCGAA